MSGRAALRTKRQQPRIQLDKGESYVRRRRCCFAALRCAFWYLFIALRCLLACFFEYLCCCLAALLASWVFSPILLFSFWAFAGIDHATLEAISSRKAEIRFITSPNGRSCSDFTPRLLRAGGYVGNTVLVQAVGRVNRKVEPWARSLSARMEPPWANMMCLAMARPRPVPPDSRERALSTR
jgi:hypothetical protein